MEEEFRRSADAGQLVRRLSLLLRRVALSYHPRPQVAALIGERWLEFLETGLGDGRFRDGPGRALLEAPYRRVAEIDGEELLRLCNDWLRALPAHPKRHRGKK